MEDNKIINVTKKLFFSNLITFYPTLLTFIRRWGKSSGLEKNIVHFQAELVKPVLNPDFAVCCELFSSVLHISCYVFPVDNIGKFVDGNDPIHSEIVQCSFLGLLSHIKIVFTYICLS